MEEVEKKAPSDVWTPHVVDMADPSAPAIISKACKGDGVFYLENHGIPDDMMNKVFNQAKAFFDLDVEEKMKLQSNDKKRGYKPVGEELVNQANMSKGGTKELFDLRRDVDPESEEARKPLRGPNVWPAKSLLPGWKATMTGYFNAINVLAKRVIVLLADGIGVDPAFVEGCFSEPVTDLRLIHYLPEVSDPGQGVFGIGEHTDFGMITLLATDDVPGLQVLVTGEWFDVPPRQGALICNVADMLKKWTNDHLHSPTHRVVNKLGRERYSIAAIVSPDFDTEVICLPPFCSEEDPPKYPPTTCGNHLLERYSETYDINE